MYRRGVGRYHDLGDVKEIARAERRVAHRVADEPAGLVLYHYRLLMQKYSRHIITMDDGQIRGVGTFQLAKHQPYSPPLAAM